MSEDSILHLFFDLNVNFVEKKSEREKNETALTSYRHIRTKFLHANRMPQKDICACA